MLEIKNLHVKLEAEDKPILKGVDLKIGAGEVHAVMGPNGSGKSTLSYVLSGRDGYEVTEGSATLLGEGLLDMEPEERAAAGLFLAFQYPVEIPGVGNMTFLRTAVNAQRKARGQDELSAGDFLKVVREKARTLKIDAEMLKRPVNVGFSGGEKKRNEILQMAMLEPKMCILDETDSGLDVDAMKLVADGVNAELIVVLDSQLGGAAKRINGQRVEAATRWQIVIRFQQPGTVSAERAVDHALDRSHGEVIVPEAHDARCSQSIGEHVVGIVEHHPQPHRQFVFRRKFSEQVHFGQWRSGVLKRRHAESQTFVRRLADCGEQFVADLLPEAAAL